MTVIPKFHILATRGKKSGFFYHFWAHFGYFGGLPYLNGIGEKNEKVAPRRYLSGMWTVFFLIFIKEFKKLTQKSSKKDIKVWFTFSFTMHTHEHVQCSEHIYSVWETKVSIW